MRHCMKEALWQHVIALASSEACAFAIIQAQSPLCCHDPETELLIVLLVVMAASDGWF